MKDRATKVMIGLLAAASAVVAAQPAQAQRERHNARGQEFTGWNMPRACTQKLSTAAEAASDQPAGRTPPARVRNRGDAQFLQSYMAEMQEMHLNFPTTPSGDPDVDFVRVAIPHHQGLLEASLRYLQSGEDQMIRKLAELFILSQRGQIAAMCDWLEKHRR